METIKIDRGLELNERRLSEDFVDVHFIIEGTRISAHRLIVSLHSDYLKTLTDPCSGFVESSMNEYIIQGISLENFTLLLHYFYTGSITIREDNIFDLIESAFFLQMNHPNEQLVTKCNKWLMYKLEHSVTIDVPFLIKVWNASETYGNKDLKESVLEFVDCRFETLIGDKILAFLSFEEIYEILCRPTLCIRSEKNVCDAIMAWIEDKRCPDNEDDSELALRLIEECRELFLGLSDGYFQVFLARFGLPVAPLPDRAPRPMICDNCVFLLLWTLGEDDDPETRHMYNERQKAQLFTGYQFNLPPPPPNTVVMPNPMSVAVSMQGSPSFYQHYGPIHRINGTLLAGDSFIFYIGGNIVGGGGKPSVNDIMSDEVAVFEITSLTWLRMTNTMPRRLLQFGAAYLKKHLYIVGGLTDEFIGSASGMPTRRVTFRGQSRKLAITRQVYRIHEADWFSSSVQWKMISELPAHRTCFNVVTIDNNTLCVVGPNYCDVLDTNSGKWRSVDQFPSRKGYGHETPAVAAMGSVIYVVNSKSSKVGNNAMWTIDLSDNQPSWQPLLPALDLRFEPRLLFAHCGYLYLIGYQSARKNFVYKFETRTKTWTSLLEGFTGHFAPFSGVLVRKQLVTDKFFTGS